MPIYRESNILHLTKKMRESFVFHFAAVVRQDWDFGGENTSVLRRGRMLRELEGWTPVKRGKQGWEVEANESPALKFSLDWRICLSFHQRPLDISPLRCLEWTQRCSTVDPWICWTGAVAVEWCGSEKREFWIMRHMVSSLGSILCWLFDLEQVTKPLPVLQWWCED